MKRASKRRNSRKNLNQLSLDFALTIPIEIHTPRFNHSQIKKEFSWDRKMVIELARS